MTLIFKTALEFKHFYFGTYLAWWWWWWCRFALSPHLTHENWLNQHYLQKVNGTRTCVKQRYSSVSAMVNFMCQLDWTKENTESQSNIIRSVSMREFLPTINIWIRRPNKANCPSWYVWAHLTSWRSEFWLPSTRHWLFPVLILNPKHWLFLALVPAFFRMDPYSWLSWLSSLPLPLCTSWIFHPP